jgi:hypothetical protein|tara:strand:+ start:1879 stop:2076 length:198 start_codon:yes stop_codon:yes gene_type:complete
MYNSKTKMAKCEKIKTQYDLIDPEELNKKKEINKPSVERKKLPSEIKYNEYVKKLYKEKKLKDLK